MNSKNKIRIVNPGEGIALRATTNYTLSQGKTVIWKKKTYTKEEVGTIPSRELFKIEDTGDIIQNDNRLDIRYKITNKDEGQYLKFYAYIEEFNKSSQGLIYFVEGKHNTNIRIRGVERVGTNSNELFIGEKLKLKVNYSVQKNKVPSKTKDNVKWMVKIDGEEERLIVNGLVITGSEIEFVVPKEWADKEVILMPYLYKHTEDVSYPLNNITFDPKQIARKGTWVRDLGNNTFVIINALEGNDSNVYVVDENDLPTERIIAQTLRPYDFLYTDDSNGSFYYDSKECGMTFSLIGLTIKGAVKLESGDIHRITNADLEILKQWGYKLFMSEVKRKKVTTSYGWLEVLRDMSGNGKALDFKVSLGLPKYTVIQSGYTSDGKPIITSLRAAGNYVFGANMRSTKGPLIPENMYYEPVMEKVGEYNQKQNNGNGYNEGYPYYGEHTYSGSYIYYGYFSKFHQ